MISIVVHITDVRHNLKNPCPSNSLTKYNPTRNGITAHNTHRTNTFLINLKSASNLNGNLNCSKELEHYAS